MHLFWRGKEVVYYRIKSDKRVQVVAMMEQPKGIPGLVLEHVTP